ncbi:hypothetical protein [Microvirga sp. ACRRW]|uniref:hypothetical protein n=1 Tax=Microvirga sp. ACRRW TaxID=2918205 RepID=UPI001EF63A63|nr:hypothetical protein [Microvirga sp. ACRRW]
MTELNAFRKRLAVSLAAIALSLFPYLSSARADNPAREQAQTIGSKPPKPSPKRPAPPQPPAKEAASRPDGAGNFVYGIINTIRAESEELCARYGNPSDCLEEAEVCLTMRDDEDNQVKMCLNTIPGESSGQGPMQRSRLRR